MRISIVFASLLLGLVGCSQAVEDPAPGGEAPVAHAESPAQNVEDLPPICPLEWTCDYRHYYATKASCQQSACGTRCEQDYYCHIGCTCP